jgi:hypothetical protein
VALPVGRRLRSNARNSGRRLSAVTRTDSNRWILLKNSVARGLQESIELALMTNERRVRPAPIGLSSQGCFYPRHQPLAHASEVLPCGREQELIFAPVSPRNHTGRSFSLEHSSPGLGESISRLGPPIREVGIALPGLVDP